MDELDVLLYDSTAGPNASYYGSLEGNDRVDGEMRLFVSCPDADRLVDKLLSWLKALSWKGGISVLKHHGELTDTSCREVYVMIDD